MKAVKLPLKNMKWLKADSKQGFNILAGINRPIKPNHVTKLAESLNKMGLVKPVTIAVLDFITGKKEKYLIDGQHTYNGCIRNSMDIAYVEITIKDKQDLVEHIALLNASSKSWTMEDYVLAWSSINPDYIKLNQYFETYDFEISVLADILSGGMAGSGGTVTRRLKRGEFRIVDEKQNLEIIKNLTDLLKIVPRMNRFENRYLCSEYVKFRRSTKDYNHDLFIKKVQKNKIKFQLATQEAGKLTEMFKSLK